MLAESSEVFLSVGFSVASELVRIGLEVFLVNVYVVSEDFSGAVA